MKDKKDFGAFEVLGSILNDPELTGGDDKDVDEVIDPPQENSDDDVDKDDNNNDLEDPSSKGDQNNEDDSQNDDNQEEGDSVNEEERNNEEDDSSEENNNNEEDDLSLIESDITKHVQEKLWEKFGWTFDDEDKKMENLDDIVDYLNDVIEQNSIPVYANEEIEKLNKYVADGGNLNSYFESRYKKGVDLSNIDITSKMNQELIIRDYFKLQGASEEKISKKIERYDETGVLEDEATDALEYLKTYREKEAQKLLDDQEKTKTQLVEQQQKFYDDVTSNIKKKKEIMGIPVNQKEQSDLIRAIFKITKEGKTEIQKEYEKDPINMTILTAYLALNKDKLNKKIDKKANNEAVRNIKKKLEMNKQKRLKGSGSNTDELNIDLFSSISKNLNKPS